MSNADDQLMDVGRLRLLREVGLRGSIAAAARARGLTSSAVSQQLATLERHAGVSLLDRSPRGVVLTGAGQALARRAGQVLEVLKAARAELDQAAGSIAGPVQIAAIASAAATFVSAAVVELRERHPGVEVSVVTHEPERSLERLLLGDVDIAVVDEYDRVPLALPEYVQARLLCAEPLVFVSAGPGAGAGAGAAPGIRPPAVELASLASADWVLPPEDAACGLAVRAACRSAGFEPRVRWESDDMLLLTRAVADGHGISILPVRSVARLAPVTVSSIREPVFQRRISAVGRATTFARPVVAAVVDTLVQHAGQTG